MKTLTYKVEINAPKEKVWDTMLGKDTYKQWTGAFHEGSDYEGSWEQGSKIRFIGPDDEGKVSGMTSQIVENRPYEYVSIEHLGEIIDGKDVLDSEMAKAFAGAHENYTFTEDNGVTTVTVDLEDAGMPQEMVDMFADMWPKALNKLKELCEQ